MMESPEKPRGHFEHKKMRIGAKMCKMCFGCTKTEGFSTLFFAMGHVCPKNYIDELQKKRYAITKLG